MISLFFAVSLPFGWMTDQMLTDQAAKEAQENYIPPQTEDTSRLPAPPPSSPSNSRQNLANEPGKTDRGVKTNTANQIAVSWLALTDQGQYGGSWLAAGPLLRDVISQDQWIAALKGSRSPLGLANSRSLKNQNTLSQLPNGTKGTFSQLVYQTQFSQGGPRTEVLNLMSSGKEGSSWQIISYQITK